MMTVTTLTDGGQPPLATAEALGAFLAGARTSLDIAVYDLKLEGETERLVIGAIEDAGGRGVAVRLAFNADFRAPIPVPPPPKAVPEDVDSLRVPTRAIAGIPDLMHHKYVVRDGASVWTGSANWTDDSWSREENVIAVLDSPALAHAFTLDFEQLWSTGNVRTPARWSRARFAWTAPRCGRGSVRASATRCLTGSRSMSAGRAGGSASARR